LSRNLWQTIPVAWKTGLNHCQAEIEEIDLLLASAAGNGFKVVPKHEDIFAALRLSPDEISVVLIGQDPYPNPDQAIGLAFAVSRAAESTPASLRNIFKEVESDLGVQSNADVTLSSWVSQGVLLLNTSLTTEARSRAAHARWPWEAIVRSVINEVVTENPKVAALLWGNHAKKFSDLFDPESVVTSAHPSPLSASRGFLGSKPFSRANQVLINNGRNPIRW
jgi:uracil-DNA glycosylase